MNISIIIPAYNEEKVLDACLDSLMKQTVPADEIIVIDNNSSDGTVDIAKKYPVTVIHEKKQGQMYAQIAGFNKAKGDIFVRIDADSQLDKDWIKNAKELWQKKPDTAAVTGDIIYYDLPLKFLHIPFLRVFYFFFFKIIIGEVPFVGANMALHKKTWSKIKKYHMPSNKVVHEDMYYSILMHKEGLHVTFSTKLRVYASGRTFKSKRMYTEYALKLLTTLQFRFTL